MGPYAPAGPNWQRAIRSDVTRSLRAVEIECPNPEDLAKRWGQLFELDAQDLGNSRFQIVLDAGAIRFLPGSGSEAVFAGVELLAAKPSTAELCGVRFRLVDA